MKTKKIKNEKEIKNKNNARGDIVIKLFETPFLMQENADMPCP